MNFRTPFNSWVTCSKPNPHAQLRMFCFPYAGGGASIFRNWSEDVPLEVEICPIQLPGHERRLKEPPFTRLVPLVKMLAKVILPYLDLPFVFLGHSMGAIISFELARQLRREQNLTPAYLFVSAYRAPQLSNPDPYIHILPDLALIEVLQRMDGTPEPVMQNDELMQLMLPTLRADFAVCETYTYSDEAPLSCPISVFGGLQDPQVQFDELVAWKQQTESFFMISMFPGNHFFLYSSRVPLMQVISQELTRLSDQITRSQNA